MTTIRQPMGETRTGLVLAWSVTLTAILAIGVVVATVPLPQLSAAALGSATAAAPATLQPPPGSGA